MTLGAELQELAREHHHHVGRLAIVGKRAAPPASNPRRTEVSHRSLRQRLDLEDQWSAAMQECSDRFFAALNIEQAYLIARHGWKPVSASRRLWEAIRKAGQPTIQDVLGKAHTLQDVIDGKYPVGVEGNGGQDTARAQALGLYTTEVNGVQIYAQTKEDAAPLVNYLRAGGSYGSPAFSRLLGYTPDEITEYQNFLHTYDAVPTPAGAMTGPGGQAISAGLLQFVNNAIMVAQSVQQYEQMAMATSTMAGQNALDHLGFNKTFSWAHPQNMAQDLFHVRGSKVIQNLYGDHLEKLSRIIEEATNPLKPMTIQEVKARIAAEWPKLQAYQVARIARTETAAVWTATAMNAYAANGVSQWESLIAQGPAIGIDQSDPCEQCIEAAMFYFDMGNGDYPPWHPNCRCEAVPLLQDPETGEEWLPPDEPWAGGEKPVCGTEAAMQASRRLSVLRKMTSVVVKATGESCLVPMPEPEYGGKKFQNVPPLTPQDLKTLRDQVHDWADHLGNTPQAEIKQQAISMLESGSPLKLARSSTDESLKGVASYTDGFVYPNQPQTILVHGIVTTGGGGRAFMGQFARDAYRLNRSLAVDLKGISPQLRKSLDYWGFKPVEGQDAMILARDELKVPFKITEEEVPTPAVPVHEPPPPVAPPAVDVEDLKAKLYSTNNRIAGHRKKIKTLTAKKEGAGAAEISKLDQQIAEFQKKLDEEVAQRDELKAQIAAAGQTPVPAVGDVPGAPVFEPPMDTPAPLPPVTVTPPVKAAHGTSTIVLESKAGTEFNNAVADEFERIRGEVEGWTADQRELAEGILNGAEAGVTSILPRGVVAIRDSDGKLLGIMEYTEHSYEIRINTFAMHYADDIEGALRGTTDMAKIAADKNIALSVETYSMPGSYKDQITLRGLARISNSDPAYQASAWKLNEAFSLEGEKGPLLLPKPSIEPANYEGRVAVESGAQNVDQEILDGIREESDGWTLADVVDQRLHNVESEQQAMLDGYSSSFQTGIVELRNEHGDLIGVVTYEARNSLDNGFPLLDVNDILMRYTDDVEGALRAVQLMAKMASDSGRMLQVHADASWMPQAFRDDLVKRGMEPTSGGWYRMPNKQLTDAFKLDGVPMPEAAPPPLPNIPLQKMDASWIREPGGEADINLFDEIRAETNGWNQKEGELEITLDSLESPDLGSDIGLIALRADNGDLRGLMIISNYGQDMNVRAIMMKYSDDLETALAGVRVAAKYAADVGNHLGIELSTFPKELGLGPQLVQHFNFEDFGYSLKMDESIVAEQFKTAEIKLPKKAQVQGGIAPQPDYWQVAYVNAEGKPIITAESFTTEAEAKDYAANISVGESPKKPQVVPGGTTYDEAFGSQAEGISLPGGVAGLDDLYPAETTATAFHDAIAAAREELGSKKAFLAEHDVSELEGNRCFLSADGKTGFSLSPTGDLQNLFSAPSALKGQGFKALERAVQLGARTLDCYDGFLPAFYEKVGFKVTGRMKFEEEFAPEGWDLQEFNHPDVIFMSLKPEEEYVLPAGSSHFVTDWDQAKADALTVSHVGLPDFEGKFLMTDVGPSEGHVLEAQKAISKVFKMPTDVEVKPFETDVSISGQLQRDGTIRIHPDGNSFDQASTIVHEYGHYVDSRVLGSPGALGDWFTAATSTGPDSLWGIMRDSPTIKKLLAKDVKMQLSDSEYAYFIKSDEMFARAFDQYVTTKSDNVLLMSNLKKLQNDELLSFQVWQDEEFKPIMAKLDEIFKEKGLLKEPPPAPLPLPDESLKVTLAQTPADPMDVVQLETLREETSTWIIGGEEDVEYMNTADSLLAYAEEGINSFDSRQTLMVMRDPGGSLTGLASISRIGTEDSGVMSLFSTVTRFEEDINTRIRAIHEAAKYAEKEGYRLEVVITPTGAEPVEGGLNQFEKEIRDYLQAKGATVSIAGSNEGRFWKFSHEDTKKLADEIGGSAPELVAGPKEITLFEDDISVETGAPVPQALVEKIHELGLGGYPPKGEGAQEVLGENASTSDMFKTHGQWQDDRLQLHYDIVNAHFAGKVKPISDSPTVMMTSGGAASGKSSMTFAFDNQEMTLSDLEARNDIIYIDADRIKQMIPEYQEIVAKGDVYAATAVHEESSHIARMIARRAREDGYNVVIDSTGSSGRFTENLKIFQDKGYNVKVSMVSIPTNDAIKRMMVRGAKSGRYVPISALKTAHKNASLQLIKWQHDNLVEWKVFDNSGANIELVAEKGINKEAQIYDSDKFKEIKEKANEGKPRPAQGEKTAAPEEHGGMAAGGGGGGFEKTPEQLKADLYSVNNKIAGWKKKLKKNPDDADAKAKLDEQLAHQQKIKDQLTAAGHKPVAAKPGATVSKPPLPKEKPTATTAKPPPSPDPEPEPMPDPEVAHEPDNRRVIPGGITKERGTSILNKKMQEGYSGYGASRLKADIMKKLTDRVKGNPNWDAEAIQKAYGYAERHYSSENLDESIMSQLIHNWAVTSSDADARGVAVQLALAKEFGLNVRVFAADYFSNPEESDKIVALAERLLKGEVKVTSSGAREGSFIETPDGRPIEASLRAFLRAQYDTTQELLDELGVDEVTLYRGMKGKTAAAEAGDLPWGPGLSTVHTIDNPIASWSIRHSISHGNYFFGGTMMRATAPKEMIFSTPLTGFGCAREYEILLLNAGDNDVWIAQFGKIQIEGERLAEMQRKVASLEQEYQDQYAKLETYRNMNNGSGPEYGTPERTEYYELREQVQRLSYQKSNLQANIDRGYEQWRYEKESDLRAYIGEALQSNPELAGKPIKTPRPKKEMTLEEERVAKIKTRISGIKRKITNRTKKMEAELEIADTISRKLAESGSGYATLPSTGKEIYATDYNEKAYRRRAEYYAREIDDLNTSLTAANIELEAAQKLVVKKSWPKPSYHLSMRKLRRRARVFA